MSNSELQTLLTAFDIKQNKNFFSCSKKHFAWLFFVCVFAGLSFRSLYVDSTCRVAGLNFFTLQKKPAVLMRSSDRLMQHVYGQPLFSRKTFFCSSYIWRSPAGGLAVVRVGRRRGASQPQRIALVTRRRLSQSTDSAKETLMTRNINKGLLSARGLMISNSFDNSSPCGDCGCRPGKYDGINRAYLCWEKTHLLESGLTGCVSHGRSAMLRPSDTQREFCHENQLNYMRIKALGLKQCLV